MEIQFALSAEPGHAEVIDDVEIKAARSGVSHQQELSLAAIITLPMAGSFISGRFWPNGYPEWAR